ncbi:unnamed protein product [Calicophoron daubneyi]|uniref:Uncharacterized protein n=1 Tax=Calicophoron daubneyi TaxID=300641 RepID=A0AAV2TA99_CALDB
MLSANLRGIKSLIPLGFDSAIFYQTPSQEHRHSVQDVGDFPEKIHPAVPYRKVNFGPSRRTSVLSRQAVPKIVPLKFKLSPIVEPDVRLNGTFLTQPVSTRSRGIQTEEETHGDVLPAVSHKISAFLHHLNESECLRASKLEGHSVHSSEPFYPPAWLALAEFNYSPALFNLGVWCERQANSCSSDDSLVRSQYLEQAERSYQRAVEVDEHPVAAYNLACLALKSDRGTTMVGSRSYSVKELMELADAGNVKQAKDYLLWQKQKNDDFTKSSKTRSVV